MLETFAVVWVMSHFNHYLYGNSVTVYTDHTAVKAVLESSNPTAKHARWWTRVYGRGIKEVKIHYRAGRENKNADALSRSPIEPPPDVGMADGEIQVATIATKDAAVTHLRDLTVTNSSQESVLLVQTPSLTDVNPPANLASEQLKDPVIKELYEFMTSGKLPEDPNRARKSALQSSQFAVVNGIVYCINPKTGCKRAVVPRSARHSFWKL